MARSGTAARGGAVLGLASLVIGCAPLTLESPDPTAQMAQEQRPVQQSSASPPAAPHPAETGAAEPAVARRRASESRPHRPARATTAAPVADGGGGRWRQLGDASYYGPEFTGRRMANGRRFDPRSTSVAHRTLPFGTRVLVRNLENGRSATATVEDRGPFIRGRIIDLSPQLAERLGMIIQGIAPVEVTPIEPIELAEAPDQASE